MRDEGTSHGEPRLLEVDVFPPETAGCAPHAGHAPLQRFELAAEAPPLVAPLEGAAEEPELRALTRLVGASGKISFEAARYHVGAWLAGEAVALTLRDGLLDRHRGVLVACHAHRRAPKARIAGEPRLDLLAAQTVADEVAPAREAHVTGGGRPCASPRGSRRAAARGAAGAAAGRSSLVHGGAPYPSHDAVNATAAPLEVFVSDLLTSKYLDLE